ncbi:hypothetical protein GCM10023115_14670 [Pontixanthobacter gangjinensis]|uniref:histidine kinase n=1 Tax=Pontixanthobacter gangjinensis TaxID=1028742 RepID=A0A6I4SLX2_9SPHN|nr:response regulator [Pontixanthobacter gangjinensis]MXO56713.1 response regulator [Pontixanthobacter gangjinensis]
MSAAPKSLSVLKDGLGGPLPFIGLTVAILASSAVIFFVGDSLLLAATFLGGTTILVLAGLMFSRIAVPTAAQDLAPPDWSVTVSAIEQPGVAVAITDRANRLTCANSEFVSWFEAGTAPPNLPLDRASLEKLTRTARQAWRDGVAEAKELVRADGTAGWHASAERAGRGEDYLIWRFTDASSADPTQSIIGWVTGQFGQLLSRAGVEAAVVSPDGIIRAASKGFAGRASGDTNATLAGQEFVSQLRSDDSDHIYFAREGRKGPSQTLIQISLADLAASRNVAANEAASLMLLVESGTGVGGGSQNSGAAATPQLEALLGALPLGLAMTDRDGRFLFGNQAFLRAVDREGQGLPQYPSDLVVKEDKSALSDGVRRFGKGLSSNGDMAIRLRSQPDEPVSLGLAGVRGLGDASVLLSLTDSTEETKLKRQVAQATKMQAVGQLAGGVAHDFNNVLTAIIGYCDLMLLRHTPGDSDYDDIQQIRANSNRAASLTRQLLAFSRQQTLRPEILQVPDVVSEVSQLLKRLMGEKVSFKVRHDRDLGPVRADPQQLEQVIINLAVNARDAIQSAGEGKGQVTMATRRVSAKDIRSMDSEIIPVADYTVLIVQDTGGGIPAELLGKIFEPFFTTKEQGKGTGLGLSTVYGIVKQTGGFIFAENVIGADNRPEGARFTIYLPVHKGEMAPKRIAEEPASASDWSGGGKVLLVEDEDMVRAVAERALSRAGYTVTTASDGEEGLAAIANAGPFDLVLSDVVMPGMDGPTMVKALRNLHPAMPIIFMSGYAEEQLRSEIDIDDMHFIPKPFSVQQIGDKVGQVLAGSRST